MISIKSESPFTGSGKHYIYVGNTAIGTIYSRKMSVNIRRLPIELYGGGYTPFALRCIAELADEWLDYMDNNYKEEYTLER